LIRDLAFVDATATDRGEAIAFTRQPDRKKSVIDLTILPNEPYKIEAHLTCRYGDDHGIGPGATLRSNEVYMDAKDDRAEISLVIPASGCPEVAGKTLLTEKDPRE